MIRILLGLILLGLALAGFWFGLRLVLRTDVPILLVTSKVMCTSQSDCNGFTDVFSPTLHIGDLVIVEGVDARNLSTAYPDSDVVVLRVLRPSSLGRMLL